jgi:hypothetical protein
MRKSARVLGQEYGLTAQEMNFVLKEEGYLDGEPGNYLVTEKGEKYAKEQYHHRGTGGYAHYNRSWNTRTWDDGIADELDITVERKKEIREAISLAKQNLNKLEDNNLADDYNSYGNGNEYVGVADDNDDMDALVAAVGMLLLAASAYGVNKAVPYIKRWWNDTAVPGLKKMKNKIAGKEEKTDEKPETVEEGGVL